MSIKVDIHDCVHTKVEHGTTSDNPWTTYTFTDARGQSYEITVLHRPIEPLTMRRLRERFEASAATGA